MKPIFNLLFVALSIFLLPSCGKKSHNELKTLDILSASRRSVSRPVSDFGSLKLLPLQTTDSCLIKNISELLFEKDCILVVHDNRCSVFGTDGKYLNDIGRKGDGPQEYLSIGNVFYRDGNVRIFDNGRHRLLTFSRKGNYQSAASIPTDISLLHQTANGLFAGYIVHREGNEPTRIKFLNAEGSAMDSIPYARSYTSKKGIQAWYYFAEACFCNYGNMTDMKALFCDTIFSIQASHPQMSPRYALNLGEFALKAEDRYNLESPRQNLFKGKKFIGNIFETKDYLFLNGGMGFDGDACFVYNKKNGILAYTYIRYALQEEKLFNKKYFIPKALSPDGGTLISYEIPAAVDGQEESNPVLSVLALK
ncbi:MAG: 6-bladed beta-propeller [Tannerella sp.]|jgi:hypothetical protein|nr:6-bladed beta-propeller [Tannerella sp.]